MNRMIATAGLLAGLFILNGCANDPSADLIETRDKINKELDSMKSQLSAVVATQTAMAAKLDAVTILSNKNDELTRANLRDSQQSKLELDALKFKLASRESQLAAGKQAKSAAGDRSGPVAAENDEALAPKTENGRTTEQVVAARGCHFEKVSFNTTLTEFKSLYPAAGDPPRSKLGESAYEISSASIGTVSITFLDDHVMTISLRYGEQQLADLGGHNVLMQRLTAKFGEPDTIENDTAKWMFLPADRFILASIGREPGTVVVTFGRVSGFAERNERMRKQDAGF